MLTLALAACRPDEARLKWARKWCWDLSAWNTPMVEEIVLASADVEAAWICT